MLKIKITLKDKPELTMEQVEKALEDVFYSRATSKTRVPNHRQWLESTIKYYKTNESTSRI